ncbi:MAG: diadenylate cyclase CdaA [Clostridiales Family XIII bacterium]|jgi:diadenylate cyclase|nr:diadenylate cyclase CdaA [Clostridiales Family XIII bacterium]
MKEFFTSLATGFGVLDVIDIAIIAFIIYKALGFIRESRAEQIVKGFIVLIVATFASNIFHLYALNWILRGVMTFGIIALVVVFQPEIRRVLEYIGRGRFFSSMKFQTVDNEVVKHTASAIAKAVDGFSNNKVGALIVMERDVTLNDFAETGTLLDAGVTPELLENIFYAGAPMHDGAAIIKDGRVYAAGCILPLSKNRGLPSELGTRHRAGIGVTEVSDAYCIIVSEETGVISTAYDGKIKRFLDVKTIEKEILKMFLDENADASGPSLKAFLRRNGDV